VHSGGLERGLDAALFDKYKRTGIAVEKTSRLLGLGWIQSRVELVHFAQLSLLKLWRARREYDLRWLRRIWSNSAV
jgi:hypothetical protein